jgi:hypothetical protein
MTMTEKLTIHDMIRNTNNGLYMEEFTEGLKQGNPIRISCFIHGTHLSPGMRSIMRQADEAGAGIDWLLTAIASWLVCSGDDVSARDGFDESGFNQFAYQKTVSKWPSMDLIRIFTLRQWSRRGAELCIRGGWSTLASGEDDSSCMYPIQQFVYADFPWGRGSLYFDVMARRIVLDDNPSWVLIPMWTSDGCGF